MIPELSIVIPTQNDGGNIAKLLEGLEEAMTGLEFEAIFADDSTDGTPEVVEAAAQTYGFDVRLLRTGQRLGGRGGAVVDGIKVARADYVVVMNADFQHPPKLAPVLYRHLRRGHADIVVASRYVLGRHAAGLAGMFRYVASRTATLLGKTFFPRRLRACTDPMAGFFCVRVDALDVSLPQTQGFQILLDMIVRSSLRVAEVPMVVGVRAQGRYRADLGMAMRFVRQLFILRFRSATARFALVGLSGGVWNLALIATLTHDGLDFVASTIVAVQIATAWNFAGTELLVFHDRRARTWWQRAWAFELLGAADLLRLPFALLLIRWDIGPVVATALTLAAAFGVRYIVASRLIYRRAARGIATMQPALSLGATIGTGAPVHEDSSLITRAATAG